MRAKGRRTEATIVMGITFAFLFLSPRILPYVPTVLASTLILHIGIELVIEALWDSSKQFIWYEWTVTLGTTIGCSTAGFLPGIGIGILVVIAVQFWHHIVDSVSFPQIIGSPY